MHVTAQLGALAVLALAALVPACSAEAAIRRQVVVVIDTDASALDDLAADPELSGASAVDTLRVDVLDEGGGVRVFREFAATSHFDWPLSFALVPPEQGDVQPTTLRIRAFRARDAEATVEASLPTLAPLPELAIDRVVVIPAPTREQVVRVRVDLSVECMGRPASFRDRTSCVDGGRPAMPFDSTLPSGSPALPSRLGTSPLARSLPCAQAASSGRICVPGGLSVLGSSAVAGLEDGTNILSPLPMRLVRVSPFFMDETELTVGRARPLLERVRTPPVRKGGAELVDSAYCTLEDAKGADQLPLNCIGEETAGELCALLGGALPTEAEWNHAATGRGQARRYPWGNSDQGCCNVSAGRLSRIFPDKQQCEGEGVEPVGAHRPSAACAGFGDVSRDGVLDLGGSLAEVLADRARPLDDPCWGPRFGILVDPVCMLPTAVGTATRGGRWAAGSVNAVGALRGAVERSSTRGVRCVYREAAR